MTDQTTVSDQKTSQFSTDIQGLRAIAVISVLIFHVWPSALPGGYIGVDVFFVISGFLITRHLVNEQLKFGTINLKRFYERRIRRLLPTAMLVLLLTLLGAALLLPITQWEQTALHVVASVFYAENWYLAYLSTDYLGAENVPTAVQHFWSLAIEEQFYFIWPIIIIGSGFLAKALKLKAKALTFSTLLLIFLSSLYFSITLSYQDNATAYFVSHTRFWELALGGLLGIYMPTVSSMLGKIFAWVGLTVIILSSIIFTKETIFPGWVALIPTLGAAAIIVSGNSPSTSIINQILQFKWMQLFGDISYSLYLIHWPLIVFWQFRFGPHISIIAGLLLIGSSIILSILSKKFLEDRYRFPSTDAPHTQTLSPIWAASSSMLITTAAAAILLLQTSGGMTDNKQTDFADTSKIIPALADLRNDIPKSYSGGNERCHLGVKTEKPKACIYGNEQSKKTAFLVGDSHALQWAPALDEVGKKLNIKFVAYTKSACPVLVEPTMLKGKAYSQCLVWGKNVLGIIANEKPFIVLAGQSSNAKLFAQNATSPIDNMINALERTWSPVLKGHSKIFMFADTPFFKENQTNCYSRGADCHIPIEMVTKEDPMLAYANQTPEISLVNFNPYTCPNGVCVPLYKNILIWRDKHHVTATFSRAMGALLAKQIQPAL